MGVGVRFDNCFGVWSTHVVEQLSFSMFPSTLAFNFDLMLGTFFTFLALLGFFGVGVEFENCFGVYSYS